MTKLEKKIYRVLALAALFFISGAWFFWQGIGERKENDKLGVNLAPGSFGSGGSRVASMPMEFTGWPDPAQFLPVKNEGQVIEVSEECRDTHLAIMLFAAEVDYRKDPINAKFNSAYECVDGKAKVQIDLAKINLIKDGIYYMIYADQGAESWYNPR